MSKLFAISDLHLSFSSDKPMDVFGGEWENYFEKICADWTEKVGCDDIVLLSGDLSWAMTSDNARADFAELAKLKGRKVIIRGNHDYWWNSYSKVKKLSAEFGIIPVQNNAVKLDNYIIAGTRGWNIANENSAENDIAIYKRERIRLELSLNDAAKLKTDDDKLVLMLHYPPCENPKEGGGFTEIIDKYPIDKVVYGHIHGKGRPVMEYRLNGVDYYLTSCDKLENKLLRLY